MNRGIFYRIGFETLVLLRLSAKANIKTFINLMNTEAVVLGHADRLDIETLRAAHRQLERRGRLTTFTLWPFWPHEFVTPG